MHLLAPPAQLNARPVQFFEEKERSGFNQGEACLSGVKPLRLRTCYVNFLNIMTANI
jgi:hypothetical protein